MTGEVTNFGHKITKPCEGMVSGNRCMWPFTFKYGKLWLCRACIAKRQQAVIERKAKEFRRRQKGS